MREQNDQREEKDTFPVHSIPIIMHKNNEFRIPPVTKRKENVSSIKLRVLFRQNNVPGGLFQVSTEDYLKV
jgi:hypothetical protein